jgi:hypothetical protein
VAVLLGIFVAVPCAQSQDSSESAQIKALIQEVNELKARISVLEAKQTGTQPSVVPAQSSSQTSAAKNDDPPAPQQTANSGETNPFGLLRGIKLQGFGSLGYKVSDIKVPENSFFGFRPGSMGNFAIGDVDLFVTSALTSKATVLSEIVFTETDSQKFETDIERLLVKYDFNDYFKTSFGRFHTATSYYNSVFHHGRWLQTAVDRPLVVEFADDGGLLPTQAIGVSVTGRIPSGKLGLNYVAEYGSADTIRPQINRPGAVEIDENNGNDVTVGLFAKPDWLPGLDVGGSFYHDRLSPDNQPIHIDQSIGSAHVVYTTPRFEFLNEGFIIQHRVEGTGQTFNTPAFYSLISQKFGRKWRPYFRYQYANASAQSPLFADVGLRHGPSAGVRFDYNDYLAFKIQYNRILRRQLATINDLALQLAFRF